jgi:hypothetical protein
MFFNRRINACGIGLNLSIYMMFLCVDSGQVFWLVFDQKRLTKSLGKTLNTTPISNGIGNPEGLVVKLQTRNNPVTISRFFFG